MQSINNDKVFFSQLLTMLENHFGTDLEIVLHDLSLDECHTIVDIRNGNVTKRSIGDMEERHGIQIKPGIRLNNGDIYGEIVYTKDARILRSSTIKIQNESGIVIGSICLNEDITNEVEFESHLRERNGFHLDLQENYAQNINVLLEKLMNDALIQSGKHYNTMNKDEKLAYIKYLDDRGAFLITKSGPKVCEVLEITKSTLYSYLDKIRLTGRVEP